MGPMAPRAPNTATRWWPAVLLAGALGITSWLAVQGSRAVVPRLAAELTHRLETSLGGNIAWDELVILPSGQIRVTNVQLRSPAGAVLTAGRLTVGYHWWALLRRPQQWPDALRWVQLDGVRLVVVRQADGSLAWPWSGAQPGDQSSFSWRGQLPWQGELRLHQATLQVVVPGGGPAAALAVEAARLQVGQAGVRAEHLAGKLGGGRWQLQGLVSLSGSGDSARPSAALDLQLRLRGITVSAVRAQLAGWLPAGLGQWPSWLSQLDATADATLQITGRLDGPRVAGSVKLSGWRGQLPAPWGGLQWAALAPGPLDAQVQLSRDGGVLPSWRWPLAGGVLSGSARWQPGHWSVTANAAGVRLASARAGLPGLAARLRVPPGADGRLSGTVTVAGPGERGALSPQIQGRVELQNWRLPGWSGERARADFTVAGQDVQVSQAEVRQGRATLTLQGRLGPAGMNLAVQGSGLSLAQVPADWREAVARWLDAAVAVEGRVGGTWQEPTFAGTLRAQKGRLAGVPVKQLSATISLRPDQLEVTAARAQAEAGGQVSGSGRWQWRKGVLQLEVSGEELAPSLLPTLVPAWPASLTWAQLGPISGSVRAGGPVGRLTWEGRLQIPSGQVMGLPFSQLTAEWRWTNGLWQLLDGQARWAGGTVSAQGRVGAQQVDFTWSARGVNPALWPVLGGGRTAASRAAGRAGHRWSGQLDLAGRVSGTLRAPVVSGRILAGQLRWGGLDLVELTGQIGARRSGEEPPGWLLAVELGGQAQGQPVAVSGRGSWTPGGMDWESVALQVGAGAAAGEARGSVVWREGFVQTQLQLTRWPAGFTLQLLRAGGLRLDPRLAAAGSVDGELSLRAPWPGASAGRRGAEGRQATPQGRAQLRAATLELGETRLDDVRIALQLSGPMVRVAQGSALFGGRRVEVAGELPLPGSLATWLGLPADRLSSAPVDLAVQMPDGPLAGLAGWVPGVRVAEGTGFARVHIRGPWRHLELAGQAGVQRVRLEVPGWPAPIEQVTAEVSLAGDRLLVRQARGRTMGGEWQATGSVSLQDGKPVADIDLRARGLRLQQAWLTGLLQADLSLSGPLANPLLAGTVSLREGGLSLGAAAGAGAEELAPAYPVRFDLRLLADMLRLSGFGVDLLASGDLRLRGTAQRPELVGKLVARRGSLSYLGTRFQVLEGSAEFFPYGGLVPVLSLRAETHVRDYRIGLQLMGPLDNLVSNFDASPPLSRQEIVSLLGLPEAVARVGTQRALSGVSREVLRTLDSELQDEVMRGVERVVRQALDLDEVHIEPEPNAQRWGLEVGKYVNPDLYVRYRHQFGPQVNPGQSGQQAARGSVGIEYRMREDFRLDTQLDSNGEARVGVQLRVRF